MGRGKKYEYEEEYEEEVEYETDEDPGSPHSVRSYRLTHPRACEPPFWNGCFLDGRA